MTSASRDVSDENFTASASHGFGPLAMTTAPHKDGEVRATVGECGLSVSSGLTAWLARELAAPPHVQRLRPAISHAGDENTPG
jgi:hypothetical protein